MRIIITDSYRQMGREAANMVAGQLYVNYPRLKSRA